jgi:hypothetical protein
VKHIAKLLAAPLLASACASAAPKSPSLEGTYRLISATRTIVATGEVEQSFGPNPIGYIMYSRDHHMMVLITNAERPKPTFANITDADRVRLFDTMAAYSGTYTFDGKVVKHHIDMSWNGVLTGTTQVREVRVEGDRLIYATGPGPTPTDGKISTSKLVWQRVPDAQDAGK